MADPILIKLSMHASMFRHRSGPDYSNAPIAMARRHPNVLEKPGDITGREVLGQGHTRKPWNSQCTQNQALGISGRSETIPEIPPIQACHGNTVGIRNTKA